MTLNSGDENRAQSALAGLRRELSAVLPAEVFITDPSELRTYESDGLSHFKSPPALVVLARSTEDVRTVLDACDRFGVPFVARGSGTGLSGGSLPPPFGVVIALSGMRAVLEIDFHNERAVLEPGIANLEVSVVSAAGGYYYAPDPSSQMVCSIGGNVAENSGGAHCLKYGFTSQHVTGLELVTPTGGVVRLGGKALDSPGYDLIGALIGSEGTLGVVTEATVRLLRRPESVRTLLAGFADTDAAGAAVSAIVAVGLLPAAIEMMDALAIEAAEAAVHCHYPEGAGAVLIVEMDGPVSEVDAGLEEVEAICLAEGASEIRQAGDDAERALIWKGRKSAFAAVGRISPNYIVQDGVVPRTALPQVLREISELSDARGIRVANVFHAGDGNLHPLVLYDAEEVGATERAEAVSAAILGVCISWGGSITGEHGVGVDKLASMAKMFTEEDLDTMGLLRAAFDPKLLCNPGKAIPMPALCGERPVHRQGVHPLQEAGLAERY